MIICMAEQSSHSGNIQKNPFNFKHLDISEASIVVNGVHEPAEAYKLDITNGDYIDLYTDFLLNIGIGNDDRDCGLDESDFLGGSFLLVFDRSKHATDTTDIHMNRAQLISISEHAKIYPVQ